MSAATPPAAQPLGSAPHRARRILVFAALALLLFVVQFARAMNRDLDPDEHQFVTPPALLAQFHLRPYIDYPYFHMPDLVLIYAGLTGWTSWKLLAARTISAIAGTTTIALLFATTHRWLAPSKRTSTPLHSAFCIPHSAFALPLLYASSRLFTYTSGWAWNHDTAVLAATAAVLLQLRGQRKNSLELLALAGFFAGLAIGIRLSFAFMIFPMALALLLADSPLSTKRRILALAIAITMALLALLPAIVLAIISPTRFYFGNLGYASLSTAYYRTWNTHGMTIVGKIGQSLQKFVSGPADAILFLGTIAAVFIWLRNYRIWSRILHHQFLFLLGVLLALWIGVMGPTPIQPQYNYMLLPIMALLIITALAASPPLSKSIRCITLAAAIATAIYATIAWYGPALLALPTPSRWKPVQQHRLAEWIAANTDPAARILTIEPTIPLEARRAVYPQYATGRFVLLVTPFQPAAQRTEFGMVGKTEIPAMLASDPPDAVFIHIQEKKQNQVDQPFIDYATQHNYRPLLSPDHHYKLWLRP